MISGLKITFHKSLQVHVNVPESWLAEAVIALNCKIRRVHFTYLSFLIGENLVVFLFGCLW